MGARVLFGCAYTTLKSPVLGHSLQSPYGRRTVGSNIGCNVLCTASLQGGSSCITVTVISARLSLLPSAFVAMRRSIDGCGRLLLWLRLWKSCIFHGEPADRNVVNLRGKGTA
jgi:hypothetical protein